MKPHSSRAFCWISLAALTCAADGRAEEREDVTFAITFNTVIRQSVYVLGDLPELGNGNPAYALKLTPNSYPLWQAAVALPKGRAYAYRYVWRNDSVSQWSNPTNVNDISTTVNDQTGPSGACPTRKGLYYHKSWPQVHLNWRTGTDPYTAAPMQSFGAGRVVGETRWRALGVGIAEREIEFYFTDGGAGRDPASGTYTTPLDAFFVQDGQVFDYAPPATVGNQSQTNFGTFFSATLNENRPYRVLLPRGYAQNTGKHYPVLYLHDGQNVFDQGPFGTWNADETANALTRGGRMQEVIMVAIDNTANRARDYITPDDIVPIGPGSGQPGRANLYAAFILNELKPVIDATYRTYADRDHTATIGSSLGGVVALYLGWDFNAGFGKIAAMSGSWQLPNFPARVVAEPSRDLRIYLDSGDSGSSNDNAWLTMNLRDSLNHKGYILERDLRHVVGYGHQHNEAAWAARLPGAYRFIFPPTEGENPLRDELFRGDLDCDADVDCDDAAQWLDCWNGPAATPACPTPPADGADLDSDGDVDLLDLAEFQQRQSGY